MPESFESLEAAMRYAVTLAARGEGHVEPNPAVGAVVVDDQLRLLGEGCHRRFGSSHAEVDALASAAGAAASDAAASDAASSCAIAVVATKFQPIATHTDIHFIACSSIRVMMQT
ncbi:MAG: hypothetical protein VB859_18775 [Planctomycetaceae bacterium]